MYLPTLSITAAASLLPLRPEITPAVELAIPLADAIRTISYWDDEEGNEQAVSELLCGTTFAGDSDLELPLERVELQLFIYAGASLTPDVCAKQRMQVWTRRPLETSLEFGQRILRVVVETLQQYVGRRNPIAVTLRTLPA